MKWPRVLCSMVLVGLVMSCSGEDATKSKDDTQTAQDSAVPGEDVATGDAQTPGEGAHPHWPGATWGKLWPASGESATYQVTTFGQETMDVTAYVEGGIEWKGGTWTRIAAGELEPGKVGQAIYLDDSTPWEVKVKGIEVFSKDQTDGPQMTEYFETPMVLPLAPKAGENLHVETTIKGNYGGFEDEMGIVYDIKVESYDATIDVPFGSLSGCVKLVATLSGELIGDGSLSVEVIVHPEQRIVRWVDAPGFILAELKTGWSK